MVSASTATSCRASSWPCATPALKCAIWCGFPAFSRRGCKVISKKQGLTKLQPGQITYVVLAEISTNEPSRLVGAAVGLALPAEGHQYGYISEHHCYGMIEPKLRDFVEDMAATMLATTLGIEFDPETAYDQRKETYRMSGQIIQTRPATRRPKATKGPLDDRSGRGRFAVQRRLLNGL